MGHLLGFWTLICASVAAQTQDDDPQKSVVKIFASVSPPNMFRPWEVTAPYSTSGSGVVIEGGRILTCAHVVDYAQEIYVQLDKSSDRLNASVEVLAPDCDLAVLKLESPQDLGNVKPLAFSESLPKLKSRISVLGYPTGGGALSVTEGVVSRIETFVYSLTVRALCIQVDAAVNPGNSGGPGIAEGKIAGIVTSALTQAQNIGYLIPAEVILHLLDDWKTDGKYDGFPRLGVELFPLENPALRRYLGLEKSDTGVVLHRVLRRDLREILHPWDVITEVGGISVDNQGMVGIEGDLRVNVQGVISRRTAGSSLGLKVIRQGRRVDLEIPLLAQSALMVQEMVGSRPSYFVYGGLIFSPVMRDLLRAGGQDVLTYLAFRGALIPRMIDVPRESPDDELVATCGPILPHKINKGYSISALSVVTHVNDQPVRNLRQMIRLIKENRGKEFVIFRFEDDREEKVVLDPKDVEKFGPEILRNNNIPAACSEDLRDLWP